MIRSIITVLIIEDDVIDAEWAQKALLKDKYLNFNLKWVDRVSKAKEILSNEEFDIVILDLNLPDGSGLELFKEVKEISSKAAIVIYSGTPIEEKKAAIEALHCGAQDYIVKGETDYSTFQKSIWFSLERNKLLQIISQKNKELNDFSYMISHDLKQPLAVIKISLAKLKYPSLVLQVQETLKRQVNSMTQKIDALLEYACAGGKIEKKEEVDLSLCVKGVIENLRIDIEKKNADIRISALPNVVVSKSLIELLFQNLLSNAIKFKKPDSPSEIFISSKHERDDLIISIKDNGIGMDKSQEKDTIFDLFHRSQETQEIPGTGIGLATCKKIIESHGGKIWYESTQGNGTIFHFSLPYSGIKQ